MMHWTTPLVFYLLTLGFQANSQSEARRVLDELRTAIATDGIGPAMNLADRLDAEVQLQYRASLVADVNDRVADALTWLPADMESFWVYQEPFQIEVAQSPDTLFLRPAQFYAIDRLRTLSKGKYYRALDHRTVRFVVAAARNIRGGTRGTPGPVAADDVVYFYFLAEPFGLPPVDEGTWIATPRPDILVVANNSRLLEETLERIRNGSKIRALPANLSEWSHVDRRISFWGLRHYADQAKPKIGEENFSHASLSKPDGMAIGVTIGFDSARQLLEINYLSPTEFVLDVTQVNEFNIDAPQPGVSHLTSNLQKRGPFPFHVAMGSLGFGTY